MISVALCTYNGEKFLGEQLESIASQTLPPDELVVCDDCSKDATLEILKDFKGQVSFPVYIHLNETNLASTKNFEKAIGLCRGEIIALCDQDDIWKPEKLERLTQTLKANPEAGYVFSDADLVDENLNPLGFSLWASIGFNSDIRKKFSGTEQFKILIMKKVVTGATMAFHAQIGKLAMPFPTDLKWIHDGWLALVASSIGAQGIPIDEPLILYRQHARQQIGAAKQPSSQSSQSFFSMYRELRKNQQAFFADWEMKCLRAMQLKNIIPPLRNSYSSAILEKNIKLLHELETHYLNRREVLTSRNPGRYGLIFREAFSGRYAQFSDSWRSIVRDLFL
jgi:glycosyltransferase involved in cell wall biosynthesis